MAGVSRAGRYWRVPRGARAPGPPSRRGGAGAPLSPSAERILALYRAGGYREPPAPKALGHLLGMKPQIALGLVEHLIERGALVRLEGGLVMAADGVGAAAASLRASGREVVDVAA